MKSKLHLIAGVLFVLALLYNFYLWGGLARTSTLGPLMVETTQRELALAGVYLPVGMWLVDTAGVTNSAAAFANARFGALEKSVLANPAAAMDTLLSGMPVGVRSAYYGAPILLLVFAFMWWRRPRGVHVIRRS